MRERIRYHLQPNPTILSATSSGSVMAAGDIDDGLASRLFPSSSAQKLAPIIFLAEDDDLLTTSLCSF